MHDPTTVPRLSFQAAVGLLLVLLAATCTDGTAPRKPEPITNSPATIVSDPDAPVEPVAPTKVGTSLQAGVTYVSFRPGTFSSSGSSGSVTILNQRTTGSLTTGLQDGGLDPVAIPADAGDTLAFTVATGGAQPLEFINEVPEAKRPTIVRTDPKTGKRDVPLNIQVRIIFSEPVISTTVTNSTLVIEQQRSQIDGDITVSPDGLVASFLPRAQLLPETEYTISVGSGILDIDGSPLDGPVTASFTTAQAGASPGTASDVFAFTGGNCLAFSCPEAFDVYLINTDGTFLRAVARDGPAHRDEGPVWSPTGEKLAFWRSGEIHVVNADGFNPVQVSTTGIHDGYLAWSPDGRKIGFEALDTLDVTWHIYVVDADGTNLVRLTPPGANEGFPGWSADGQRIYFLQDPQNVVQQVYVMNADGTNRVHIGTLPDGAYVGPWSPDGSKLAYHYNDDIYVMETANGNAFALADSPTIDHYPAWSPDGSRIVYSEEGVLFVKNADGTNPMQLTSPSEVDGYDSEPGWSPDGSAVVFTRRYLCEGGHICDDELRIAPLSGFPFASSRVTAGEHPSWRP